MTEEIGIKVENPSSIWHRKINVDLKSLLMAGGKAGINIAFLHWDNLADNGVEVLNSLGLSQSVEEIGGLLIWRSLKSAINEIHKHNGDLFNEIPQNCKDLFELLGESLSNSQFVFDENFFNRPQNLAFLEDMQRGFEEWLKLRIKNPLEANNISRRLPGYFANALFRELNDRQADYQILIAELDNSFRETVQWQQGWFDYRAWLQKQVQEPVFWESFSLKQIYIPLRAYYEKKDSFSSDSSLTSAHQSEIEFKKIKRVVVDIAEELENWLNKSDPKDAIRFVTGSPGSGKSSFAKIFASQQAEKGRDVLFIPLHLFDLIGDLVESVAKFLEYAGFLKKNPLESTSDLNLLIIFDGLDELSKQGQLGEQIVREFVNTVSRTVKNFNLFTGETRTRLQVILLGREIVIQGNISQFNKPSQLLHILPYFLSENEIKDHQYVDQKELLDQDQRQLWWQKYGKAKGQDYTRVPEALNQGNLIDITAQPLLNYLIALSYERKKITFEENTNLNEIYEDLLSAVHERAYEKNGHLIINGITKMQFLAILMEIALACWHGNGRTTTVKEIENHCESSGIKSLLQQFQDSFLEYSRASITRLLTAFYFRESSDLRGSAKTFEFIHKSFGEYLIARRIVLGIETIELKLKGSKDNFCDDYNEKNALITWVKLCGSSPIDSYIFAFILEEIRLRNRATVQKWQQLLCRLIEYVMIEGTPMEALNLNSFKIGMEQSRNAEIALLVLLNACARVTEKLSNIKWYTPEAFGEWISRLVGQRKVFEPVFVLDCLSYLNLQDCNLNFRDFYLANLEGANLEGANLLSANLGGANLLRANLVGANLLRANLGGANLGGANLLGANLGGAHLLRANLGGVNLLGANLGGAHLLRANLVGANLLRANLGGANLLRANLGGANLLGANLLGANLLKANLGGANLLGANLLGANLEGVNLEGANLLGANLEGANIERDNLQFAKLQRTILDGKDMKQITG